MDGSGVGPDQGTRVLGIVAASRWGQMGLSFPVVRFGWRFANALVGRFGNKMVVVAEREAG